MCYYVLFVCKFIGFAQCVKGKAQISIHMPFAFFEFFLLKFGSWNQLRSLKAKDTKKARRSRRKKQYVSAVVCQCVKGIDALITSSFKLIYYASGLTDFL